MMTRYRRAPDRLSARQFHDATVGRGICVPFAAEGASIHAPEAVGIDAHVQQKAVISSRRERRRSLNGRGCACVTGIDELRAA